jgi:glycosyltransferase involved in cell wall biosynthesis
MTTSPASLAEALLHDAAPVTDQSPTRTILIHQAFVSPDQPGGTRHFEFARFLAGKGHHFAIVGSDLSYLTGQQVGSKGLARHEARDGIDVYRAYTYRCLHRGYIGRLVSLVSFAVTSMVAAFRAGPADVIMGTTPPIFQAVSASIVAFCRRKPLLLEVRDLWPAFLIDLGVLRNPLLIAIFRWTERNLYRYATRLLVNSPAYRDYLIEHGVAPEKIALVPNGVDPSMFSPEARGQSIRQSYGLAGKFVITYAGALGLANDIDTLLEAAAQLRQSEPRIHFLLVGDGKERPRLQAKALATKLDNVTFAGAQPKHRMSEFLAASDACVATLQNIPMFCTTYPNKVFDYMAAGRPTILAIDGVIREVIEHARGGIFAPPGNPAALAEAACMLCRDPALCGQMGADARSYVVKHFNREQQAQGFLQAILDTARA